MTLRICRKGRRLSNFTSLPRSKLLINSVKNLKKIKMSKIMSKCNEEIRNKFVYFQNIIFWTRALASYTII